VIAPAFTVRPRTEAPSVEVQAALQRDDVAALAEQLYGHVIECIDFGALFGLEQLLWHLLDQLGLGSLDDDGDLSKWLMRRAIVRAAHDPMTSITDVPYGVTKAEAKAVRFDPDCQFCCYEREHPRESAEDEHDHDDESCSLCDEMAREWRERNKDALRRAGLRPTDR
jgi:hypothetical protein